MIFVQISQSATTKLTIQSLAAMEIRFVHRTCSGVVVNFCLGENLASLLTLHFPSLPRSHSFVFFAVHKTHRIFLSPFSCQMIVFKKPDQTPRHQMRRGKRRIGRGHLPFSSPGDHEKRPNSPAGSSAQTPDEKDNNFGALCTRKTAFDE